MVVLSSEKMEHLDSLCDKTLEIKGVRFIAIIDKLGNKISGGFKKNIKPLIPRNKAQMHYMQLCLDISMRKDFQKNLGDLECVIAERKKANIICIPFKKHFLMISTDKYLNSKTAISKINKIFLRAKKFL